MTRSSTAKELTVSDFSFEAILSISQAATHTRRTPSNKELTVSVFSLKVSLGISQLPDHVQGLAHQLLLDGLQGRMLLQVLSGDLQGQRV